MARARGIAPIALSLLVTGLLVALFGLSSTLNPIDALLGRGAVVTVPDLSGATQPVAEAQIKALGLVPEVATAYSLSGARGTVVGQDPPKNSRVREGSHMKIVVSRGINRVDVTDVVGKPVAEARKPFDEADVKLDIKEETSETVPAGVVISQNPGAGVVLTGKDTMHLVVSKGAVPRPVPQVVGLPPAGAGYQLGKSGLAIGTVTSANDPKAVAGSVLSTAPPAGTSVDKGTPVNVVVAAGPAPVPVPDVTGKSQAAATSALQQVGFIPNVISGRGDAVASQSPVATTPLAPGQPVTITLGSVGAGDDHHGAGSTGWLRWSHAPSPRHGRQPRRARRPRRDRHVVAGRAADPGSVAAGSDCPAASSGSTSSSPRAGSCPRASVIPSRWIRWVIRGRRCWVWWPWRRSSCSQRSDWVMCSPAGSRTHLPVAWSCRFSPAAPPRMRSGHWKDWVSWWPPSTSPTRCCRPGRCSARSPSPGRRSSSGRR